VELARDVAEAGKEKGVNVAVAPQYADIYRVASQVGVPVLAQHVDSLAPGRGTGWLLPEAAKEVGAVGSLVNHSERRLELEEIRKIIDRLRELELASVVCAKDVETAKKVAAFRPDAVAVEPPELIGTGRAVSKVKPEVVRDAVREVHGVNPDVRVFCGAGISSGEDARVALELGAEGVLVASCVVKAEDPRTAALDLAEGVLKAHR
ncbi:MAG: triose-phosphate isomerase, partial [Candidatus Hadarchaeota archaeon]|nr:triose-phosphate isomerase [Candidatus Hadarchaeota archaeon]